jgi:hypothetical protein
MEKLIWFDHSINIRNGDAFRKTKIIIISEPSKFLRINKEVSIIKIYIICKVFYTVHYLIYVVHFPPKCYINTFWLGYFDMNVIINRIASLRVNNHSKYKQKF